MSFVSIVILFLISFSVSALLTYRFCNPDSVIYILDHPNERSLHDRPIPRGGGVAIIVSFLSCGLVVAWYYPIFDLAWILLSIVIVAVVSYIDDRFSVHPIYRLIAHLVASIVLVFSGFILLKLDVPGMSWTLSLITGASFSILFLVWMINLYNFMDGIDGFAGGMAVIGFGTFALLGLQAGNTLFMTTGLIVAAAAAGFLLFNFPPAQIFMGDVGSSTLGLLAGVFSLWGVRDGIFPFWVALLVFSPFIVDATATLSRRLFQRHTLWHAHKSHYYQQLVQSGWSHRKTVIFEYIVMFGCGMTALWAMSATSNSQSLILGGWSIFYILVIFWITRNRKRFLKTSTI